MGYQIFKQLSNAASEAATKASKLLNTFHKSSNGLTPYAICCLPEFQAANRDYKAAAAELRHYNGIINKSYKKELRADVRARNAIRYS